MPEKFRKEEALSTMSSPRYGERSSHHAKNNICYRNIVILVPCLIIIFVLGQYISVHVLDKLGRPPLAQNVESTTLSRAEILEKMKTLDEERRKINEQIDQTQLLDRTRSNPALRGSISKTPESVSIIMDTSTSESDKLQTSESVSDNHSSTDGLSTRVAIVSESTDLPTKEYITNNPDANNSFFAGKSSETSIEFAAVPSPPGEIDQAFSQSFKSVEEAAVTTPVGMDSAHIAIGVWVYLEGNVGDDHDKDMRTILSNKHTGCEAHEGQYGFAVYVNGWQLGDRKLYLEYGSRTSGCHKLISHDGFAFPNNQWMHVAVVLQKTAQILYVNGVQVAHSGTALDQYPAHEVNNAAFTVGMYDLNHFPLHGRLRNLIFAAFSGSSDDTQRKEWVRSAMLDPLQSERYAVEHIPFIRAYFPLNDEHKEQSHALARNVVGGKDGYPAPQDKSVNVGPAVYRFPNSREKGNFPFGLRVALVNGLEQRQQEPSQEDKNESAWQGHKHGLKIKEAVKMVWDSYVQHSFGRDELHPVSLTGTDNWGGMGVTLVDALDTLWIMGLKDEFEKAKDWVARHLTFRNAGTVSVFETTIRELGGLLSAYDFSKDPVFLDKAKTLGDLLSPAFATSSGIATGQVDLRTGHTVTGWQGSSAILSEFGTLQIEFRNLAQYSGQKKYEDMAMRGMRFMHSRMPKNGLIGVKVDIVSGHATDPTITLGALGDSFYEYLLKVWIQGGKKEAWYREMYDNAVDGIMDLLIATSDVSGLVFVADWNGHSQHRKMDHLVCFLPGVLALGAHTDPTGADSERAKRDLAVAKALMYTCREMYHRQVSGISPEYVEFPKGEDMTVGTNAPFYILRPEVAESLFVLGQLTGDPIYRQWSWEIWEAIDRHCRVPGQGYGALRDVSRPKNGVDDRMESFFLAETVKYLYLAQEPRHGIDLDKYVFNTEAHPTLIFDDSHVPVSVN